MMPRRTRTELIRQKKVRSATAEPKPHGDMRFPETHTSTARSAA